MSDTLLDALGKAEAERETVCQLMEQADQEIAAATIKRPTAAQVQEAWGNIGRIWKVLNEDERTDLLGSFVQRVELTEKESVTLELFPVSMSPSLFHSQGFELNSYLGGDTETITTNPQFFTEPLYVPAGGKSRKKIPRLKSAA